MNSKSIKFVKQAGLVSSIHGFTELDPDADALLYAFFCGYSYSDPQLRLDAKIVGHDVKRLCDVINWFKGLRGQIYCYETGSGAATAESVLPVLKRTHSLPTIIAIFLHTELCDGERAFIPAGIPEGSPINSQNVVFYSVVADMLLKGPIMAPVALLTETCNSDNIIGVPWMGFVELVNGERQLKWEETGLGGHHDWKSMPLMVQLAATRPDEQAVAFPSTGSVYTRSLYNAWHEPFKSMMTSTQEGMDSTLKGKNHKQHHVIYSSRIIGDDEILWVALGLETSS